MQSLPIFRLSGKMLLGMIVLGILMTVVMETFGMSELGFVFNAAYIGGFAMAASPAVAGFVGLAVTRMSDRLPTPSIRASSPPTSALSPRSSRS